MIAWISSGFRLQNLFLQWGDGESTRGDAKSAQCGKCEYNEINGMTSKKLKTVSYGNFKKLTGFREATVSAR